MKFVKCFQCSVEVGGIGVRVFADGLLRSLPKSCHYISKYDFFLRFLLPLQRFSISLEKTKIAHTKTILVLPELIHGIDRVHVHTENMI